MSLAKLQPPLDQSPGCCRICQAVDGREWFLDLGYIEDFWGRVVYCNLCFNDLAVAAEYSPNAKFKAQMDQYYVEINSLREAYWETSGAVDVLAAAGFNIRAFHAWLASVVNGETTVELRERSTPVADGKKGTDEPSDGEGPNDASVLELSF